jgi:Holliday junction DNA helicase RuvA
LIGYLEGTLLKIEEERILLLVNQIGYEILIPPVVRGQLSEKHIGDGVALYTYFQQTERQPRPVLIGFMQETEKDFFQQFITVEDIGPLKALKALDRPIAEIAEAIEAGDVRALTGLKGIGQRTAQKVVATLAGKMEKFLAPVQVRQARTGVDEGVLQQVLDVMVNQLGHRVPEARKLISEAIARNPAISTPEALFDEVYRGDEKK